VTRFSRYVNTLAPYVPRGVATDWLAWGLYLIRPARKDEPARHFPGWLRQRVEAIIWTLKGQLGLDRHRVLLACGHASWASFGAQRRYLA
jgi:hypothetical protein